MMELTQLYSRRFDGTFESYSNNYYEVQVLPIGATDYASVMHYELFDAKNIDDAITIFERHVVDGTFAKALEKFYGADIDGCELAVSVYKFIPMIDYIFKAEL